MVCAIITITKVTMITIFIFYEIHKTAISVFITIFVRFIKTFLVKSYVMRIVIFINFSTIFNYHNSFVEISLRCTSHYSHKKEDKCR